MFKVGVDIKGFDYVDFDKRIIKKTLKQQHPPIRNLAKKLISRRGNTSAPGEFPARQTGLMVRSVKSFVSKKGWTAIIGSYPVGRMLENKDGFYPAYLMKGTKRGIKKRKNFIEDAFNRRREIARDAIRDAMISALVPRKINK